MSRENLQSQIATLSADEKLELLDFVWESLEAGEFSATEAQRADLDCRRALYESNPDRLVPWEEVRARHFGQR